MIDPSTVDAVLGFKDGQHHSLLELSKRIEQGFPLGALARVSGLIAPDDKQFAARIVPAGTLKRRRQQRKPLTPAESERLQRAARAWAATMDVYADEGMARQFLTRPHPMLESQTPLEVALRNAPGLEAVEGLLGRAKYGSAA